MEALFQFLKRFERYTKNTDLLVAAGLLGIMAVMIIPLPAFMLDIGLTISLAISILILLISVYVTKALDFSIFPSLLLITTLFRLALNVATTRVILSHGHEGPNAAGSVIHAFGNFVIGNNYVIGFIVFVLSHFFGQINEIHTNTSKYIPIQIYTYQYTAIQSNTSFLLFFFTPDSGNLGIPNFLN